jgi:CheY-like chemotaxis protein
MADPLPSLAWRWSASDRMRVLVVDDYTDNALSTAEVLERSGHSVRVAFSGSVAVKQATLFKPQLILMDIGMSGLDGVEACKAIRRFLGNEVVIIAVTGQDSEEDRRRTTEAGFNAHLVKPLDWHTVNAYLSKLAGNE